MLILGSTLPYRTALLSPDSPCPCRCWPWWSGWSGTQTRKVGAARLDDLCIYLWLSVFIINQQRSGYVQQCTIHTPAHMNREWLTRTRQVLRLTQKVRREYEHPESAQLNFEATFCGIFSLWLPCWAQIWIVQHKNSVFLMRNRIHTQNSQRNHLLSLILSSGTLFDKWISHIRRMDLSFAGVLFLYNSTLQLVRLTWNDHTSENAVF